MQQPRRTDGDGRRGGELDQQVRRPVAEGRDPVAPDRQHPDHLLTQEHRGADDAAVVPQPLRVGASVLGVGEHVSDLLRTTIEPDASHESGAVHRDRVLGHEGPKLVCETGRPGQTVRPALEEVDEGSIPAAETTRVQPDRAQDRLDVRTCLAQRLKDLPRRLQLVEGVRERRRRSGATRRRSAARRVGHRSSRALLSKHGPLPSVRPDIPVLGCGAPRMLIALEQILTWVLIKQNAGWRQINAARPGSGGAGLEPPYSLS